MRFKQAVIEYSMKHGVTAAAIRYKTTRQNIYRWRKKYDGTIRSLADRSHRPHSHPNQPTIASDGRTLFFASNRPGGMGESDIYFTYLKDDGTFVIYRDPAGHPFCLCEES